MSRTPPPLNIRLATIEDVNNLYKVIEESYRGRGGWTTEADLVGGQRIAMEDLTALLTDQFARENKPILVAELDTPDANGDRLIGCIQCANGTYGPKAAVLVTEEEKKIPSEVAEPAPPTSSAGTIGLFGVLPTYQSKGIGRILVEAALKHIREVWKGDRCEMRILESRPELLSWYEKLGFVWKGERIPFFVPQLLLKKVDFLVLERVI